MVTARHRRYLMPLLAFAVFIGLWQAVSSLFAVPTYLLPSPIDIVEGGRQLGYTLFSNAAETLKTILLGFLLSCLVGIPLGILVSVNRTVSEAFYPIIVFLNAIPIVAIAPVIVVIFGTDMTARLIIVTLIAFFPIMVATATGILDTPEEMRDLAAVTGAGTLVEVLTIRLPHAMTFVFGGLRIGVTVAVVGAVVAEFVNANKGLGFLVVSSTSQFEIGMAMACVTMLALISVLLYQAVGLVQRLFFDWTVAESR
ncbi:ABC transporter permease [Rhizobium halophytocola]|uniref:NitT/TauT family transport system permease protein n=1 Tax=Rhizobium halophytocola TaxID=735519 RepID=A0ABS4DUA6_9HYPH|nr:ABC transporter permease [Rhizobium halophytocola]MBP1849199.1 NitT/TauT family transport system permease protein [Rhizobium halophytocola]